MKIMELIVLQFIPDYPTCTRQAAAIVLPPREATGILPVLGLEIDIGMGAVIGMIVFYTLYATGFKHIAYKGVLVGLLAWTVIDMTLDKFLQQLPSYSFAESQISLLIHIMFGLTTVYVARKLSAIRER